MTFREYLIESHRSMRRHSSWRYGQTLFNVLLLYRPDLAEKVRGTPNDPFHLDDSAASFLKFVESNW